MIHIAIGTKAQCIKMAPLMQRLQEKNITFNLIDLGQHSLITKDLREEFKIKEPDVYVAKGRDISHVTGAVIWLVKIFFKSISSRWVKKNVFLNRSGICLIHGDTASTLVGLYLAKRAGLKVAHVEAGLRSFCWFEPFPEEIIRSIAMKCSDMLFAPSQWAFDNLVKMGLGGKSIRLRENTGRQATLISLSKTADVGLENNGFCVVTFHRIENIFSRKRMLLILGILEKISKVVPVVFVQHAPTLRRLKKSGLLERLEKIKNVRYFKILGHAQFIQLLFKSGLIITDGGSIQEESYYLGKPCLLLRRHTERMEGLDENVVLSNFDKNTIQYFVGHYMEFKRPPCVVGEAAASEEIISRLKEYCEAGL
jgi:UDP-N-acetylglucosamine 2-epimerase